MTGATCLRASGTRGRIRRALSPGRLIIWRKLAGSATTCNSHTGILWCFGLFDRPWPPERKIFGAVRYMSSENTAREFGLEPYYAYGERLPTIAEARSGRSPDGLRSPAARR